MLRDVLVGNLPLYAAQKDKTSFATHAFIVNFYNKSAYRIVGGSDKIAEALLEVLTQYGGRVLTRHKVTKILVEGKYATGVLTDNGTVFEDPASTKLRTLCIGAEPHTEEQRRRIERMLGVKAYNSFGMTEMNGPGVAFECKYQDGMHLWEDNYIVEIVDPDTLEPVPDGVMGEMVLTTLDRNMMPILRYRTRDLTRIIAEPCKCGRTHRRIDRIKGRTDDMFIIKGVNVFPMQVEKILVQYPGLGSNYLITLETIDDNDVMTVEVELEGLETDIYPEMQQMMKDIQRALKDEILLTPRVKLVKKGSLPQSEGKAVRVKDLRPSRG